MFFNVCARPTTPDRIRLGGKYWDTGAVQSPVRSSLFALFGAGAVLLGCEHDRPTVAPSPDGQTDSLACKRRVDASELLPSDSMFVAFYDMDRERRFAPRVSARATGGPRSLLPVEMEAVRMGWIGIAAACELDDRFFGKAWIAVDREEEVLVVLEGKGIGNERNLRCIKSRLEGLDESFTEGLVIKNDGCGVSMNVDFDDMSGFAPRDDLLVVGFDAPVERARDAWNSGFTNPPTELLPPKRSKAWVWGALDVSALLGPDEVDAIFADTGHAELGALSRVSTVEFEASLARKFSLRLGGTFGNASDVRAAQSVLQAFVDAPPPQLPVWARALIGRIELDTRGQAVSASMSMDRKKAHTYGLLPSRTEARQMPAFAWLSAIVIL